MGNGREEVVDRVVGDSRKSGSRGHRQVEASIEPKRVLDAV